MDLAILVEGRYLSQRQPAGLIAALEARGHRVRVIDSEETLLRAGDCRWLEGLDGVIARGRNWPLLALLGWAERIGIPTINQRATIAQVLNKGDMAMELAHAGISTPATFVAAPDTLALELPAESYPLIIKPLFGDNARDIQIVRTSRELRDITWAEPVALAQCFIPSDGYDLKLYGMGDDVFTVRKRSPLTVEANGGEDLEAVPAPPELEKLARACMDLFGLELYGIDCIETPDGPVVIEVNDFPNYSGVPGSDELLADHVESRLDRSAP